ncbi:MAG: cob(I)yrinic acid a,c-diamide adenosyltransferase [Blautia sp.]|nr:cob(I)yrinic acid a,c-diamide adenosyltransferase [Blautia sp.]
MKVYTKNGDRGTTSLMNGLSVSKSDDRIELLGTIDELSSCIGLAKVLSDDKSKEELSHIQRNLIQIMAGIADPRDLNYRFSQEETTALEHAIDEMEAAFPRVKEFVLYGGCELSARLDFARSVARRAERRFRRVSQNYGADAKAVQYINRLSDYLYICARYTDYKVEHDKTEEIQDQVVRKILKDR